MKLKGYLYAAIAAAAYGTNPAFAVPLYENGMNANSVLLFRYALGVPMLAVLMKTRGQSLVLPKKDIVPVSILGILMALSSLTLFESYNCMNSGVASAMLFVYPVMVAIIMMMFFHERFRWIIGICLLLMGFGVGMLMKPGDGYTLNAGGCVLVMISALTYAVYIVMTSVSSRIRALPTSKLMLYVLTFGSLVYLVSIILGTTFTLPSKASDWINLFALAVIPTIISLTLTTRAIQIVGSTPTAILGALEPVTAVLLSVIFLHQEISPREIIGAIFIVAATVLVISDKSVEAAMLRVRKLFPKYRHIK